MQHPSAQSIPEESLLLAQLRTGLSVGTTMRPNPPSIFFPRLAPELRLSTWREALSDLDCHLEDRKPVVFPWRKGLWRKVDRPARPEAHRPVASWYDFDDEELSIDIDIPIARVNHEARVAARRGVTAHTNLQHGSEKSSDASADGSADGSTDGSAEEAEPLCARIWGFDCNSDVMYIRPKDWDTFWREFDTMTFRHRVTQLYAYSGMSIAIPEDMIKLDNLRLPGLLDIDGMEEICVVHSPSSSVDSTTLNGIWEVASASYGYEYSFEDEELFSRLSNGGWKVWEIASGTEEDKEEANVALGQRMMDLLPHLREGLILRPIKVRKIESLGQS
ncbi:hypothetical protein K461DRAFT_302026 [Myriangium duriaei CBS 260.36]|uniref:Uncharacterized protein n=1 Tax=Myriangium duriaei CBS 260.36 TaxID=1168546 RepID=A0A9P4IU09_9PEZI|nr:hypothetical protein K461DRAFT_302026 [Myriangium duriaei CBS 260.36]